MESSTLPIVCDYLVGQSLIPIALHRPPVDAKSVRDMSLTVHSNPVQGLIDNFVIRPTSSTTTPKVATFRRHRRRDTQAPTVGIGDSQNDAHQRLYHACADGSLAVIEAVLRSQNYHLEGLRGPIVRAAGRGFVSCVRRLVSHFKDRDCTLDEILIEVALAAARTRNLDMMKLAVDKVSEEGTGSFREWVLP